MVVRCCFSLLYLFFNKSFFYLFSWLLLLLLLGLRCYGETYRYSLQQNPTSSYFFYFSLLYLFYNNLSSFFLSFFMASSSSSAPCRTWKYDVFPSFRGEDVRKSFLSHLLKELDRKLIVTFKDHGIERSHPIAPELLSAIRESNISIVIFSENYASSTWCLNELVEIHDCYEKLGQMVIPIFYKVDPSDVRKQMGEFGKNFEETCKGKTEVDKQRWIQALKEVASIAGEDSLNWSDEAKMIEQISKDVSNKLCTTTNDDLDDFVGIDAHIKEIKSKLCLESEGVRMVGIVGPSGIGKSTIARALYTQLSSQFHYRAFESYKRTIQDENRMKLAWEEQFLSVILGMRDIKIDTLGMVKQRVKNKNISGLTHLRWRPCPLRCMPSNFHTEQLVELDISGSELEKLWEGVKPLENLKSMSFYYCVNLTDIPDLSKATNLVYMDLSHCYKLTDIPDLSKATNLKSMSLSSCYKLTDIRDLSKATNLEYLELDYCRSLEMLPCSIWNCHMLKELNMRGCTRLEVLPTDVNLVSLEKLNLGYCSRLRTFPQISTNIKKLDLDQTAIEEVPSWIENMSKLQELDMRYSKRLKNISRSIFKLRHLRKANFSHCKELTSFSDASVDANVARIPDFRDFQSDNLKHFRFDDCMNLDQNAQEFILQLFQDPHFGSSMTNINNEKKAIFSCY